MIIYTCKEQGVFHRHIQFNMKIFYKMLVVVVVAKSLAKLKSSEGTSMHRRCFTSTKTPQSLFLTSWDNIISISNSNNSSNNSNNKSNSTLNNNIKETMSLRTIKVTCLLGQQKLTTIMGEESSKKTLDSLVIMLLKSMLSREEPTHY